MPSNSCDCRKLRLRRFFNPVSGRITLIPLDHGVTLGPIPGLANMRTTITSCLRDSVNGIILHKGSFLQGRDIFCKNSSVNFVMHLSASVSLSPNVNNKVLVASVEEAIRLGADAVSIHVNLGVERDHEMLQTFGRVSDECNQWGIPLIAMMYSKKGTQTHDDIAIAARVAMEMGADIVKTSYSGDRRAFSGLCSSIGIPVVIAGGEQKTSDRDFFQEIYEALESGVSGIAAGRNVFQHRHPELMIQALDLLINHDVSVNETCDFIENEIQCKTMKGEIENVPYEAVMV